MPELPEIEIVKRSLFKMVNRAKIVDIIINNKNLRYKISHKLFNTLIGEKILRISRRSKYLIFHFRKKILLAHLGMSGKLFVIRDIDNKTFKTSFYYDLNVIKKHNHVFFKLNNGHTLIYNDVRRFGFFKIYNKTKINKITFLNKLGVEPFSQKLNVQYFKNFIKTRKKKY